MPQTFKIEVRQSLRFCVIPGASYVVTHHVYFIVRNEGSVFQNEIWTLRIHSGHFENSTVMRYTSNCCHGIMCFCFLNTAVSCQLYSSTKLILICFQNIFFKKEVCAP
jgi:hypothetical protein